MAICTVQDQLPSCGNRNAALASQLDETHLLGGTAPRQAALSVTGMNVRDARRWRTNQVPNKQESAGLSC
jgi:hypothetical protein